MSDPVFSTNEHSIGIVTTFYFQTQPAPTSVVNWVYEIPMANSNVAANAFSHIQSFSLNASVIDDKTGLGVTPSPSSFHISGTYHGDEATFRSKVQRGQAYLFVAQVLALNIHAISRSPRNSSAPSQPRRPQPSKPSLGSTPSPTCGEAPYRNP